MKGHERDSQSVWPDVGIKSSPIFPIVARATLLNEKASLFEMAQKSLNTWATFERYFVTKIFQK